MSSRYTMTSFQSMRRRPAGFRARGIEFVLEYIETGSFGEAPETPETIHEKAHHLLRLLVANHPFVDGNKRTALNTTVVFYLLNGYRLEYGHEVREILKQFGTDEAATDEDDVVDYLRTHTKEVDLDGVIEQWRNGLVRHGLEQLADDTSDPNQ